MNSENFHTPVLLNEAVRLLINENLEKQIIVDGTMGGGGYTRAICNLTGIEDKVIAMDKDIKAIENAKINLNSFNKKLILVNENFAEIKKVLSELNIDKITGLVLDLGLSSYQLQHEDGFSFMRDTLLDMRADKRDTDTASDILNLYSKKELSEMFENYGEIGNAGRLSDAIIHRRKTEKYRTTFDLVNTVKNEYELNKRNLTDFLAKIFQALRIKVNNELENLETVLRESVELLTVGGRIVVISYHSLEDRRVKNFFKEKSARFIKGKNPFFDEEIKQELKILTKRPVVPDESEVKFNSRSRSAKLRAAEKL